MATQAFLFAIENAILNTTERMKDATKAVKIEHNCYEGGKVNPLNRDIWGTLRVNAEVLKKNIEEFLKETEIDFGPPADNLEDEIRRLDNQTSR